MAAAVLLAMPFSAGRASAQAPPPLPGDTGAGSLPSTRAAAAAAEGEVPASTAPEIRLRGFGFPTGAPPPEPVEPGRRWTVTPSIGLQLLGTDNAFQTQSNRRSDLITTITPALTASADTSRFRGVMNYAPNIQVYADTPHQNRVDHRFNGQGLATLIPDLLYLDVRGSSAVQTITGGYAPEATVVSDRRNQIQTISLQASPYLVHRFGDFATVQAGYAFQYVDQSTDAQRGQAGTTVNGLPAFVNQNYTANEFYAVGRTGPDFGRFALEGRLTDTEYSGTGVMNGAYRRLGSVEARYALVRGLSALVEGGYEQARYAGTPGYRVDGPIWAAGLRVDFSAESYVIAKYGRRDGFDAPSLQASLALGGRTRLSANYQERLSTSTQRAGDLLSTTSLDQFGNPIDLATGLPYIQPFASSFLGVQSSLMRLRTGSAAIVQSWPRDTIAVGFSYQEQKPLSIAPGTAGFEQRGTSASITWAHEFTERTLATAYVQYGTFTSGVLGNGDLVTASLTLSHQLQPRLLATLQIATSSRSDERSTGRVNQNLILLALRQSF